MDQASISATLQTYIKDLDNPTAFRTAGVLWSQVQKYGKFWEKEGIKSATKPSQASLTDEERREKLVLKLDAMLDDPKTSAADIKEFRDYFGLGGKKMEQIINITDYKDAYPEGYDKILLAAKCIDLDIKAANS